MAGAAVVEPASESRTRWWVLVAFLVCYAACAPLWYATSRVSREPLPDIGVPDSNITLAQHTLPVHITMIQLSSGMDMDEWTRWSKIATVELRAGLKKLRNESTNSNSSSLNSSNSTGSSSHRLEWRVDRAIKLEGAAVERQGLKLHRLRDNLAGLDDFMLQFAQDVFPVPPRPPKPPSAATLERQAAEKKKATTSSAISSGPGAVAAAVAASAAADAPPPPRCAEPALAPRDPHVPDPIQNGSVTLPEWRMFILVPQSRTDAPTEGTWVMGRHRHAYTWLNSESTNAQRKACIEKGAALLHELIESQACVNMPGALTASAAAAVATATPASPSSAGSELSSCASSRSLSQRLSFTLLNDAGSESSVAATNAEADEQAQSWSWDFRAIQSGYLGGFLKVLGPYVGFTVDSNVVHYAHLAQQDPTKSTEATHSGALPQPINPNPVVVTPASTAAAAAAAAGSAAAAAKTVWSLPTSSLQNLIGSIGEWNSQSPLVSSSMELLAYIPPKSFRPLVFQFPASTATPTPTPTTPAAKAANAAADKVKAQGKKKAGQETAMVVPQFGGVVILNDVGNCTSAAGATPATEANATACQLPAPVVKDMMQVFMEQIRNTLAFKQQSVACPSCVLLPSPRTGVSKWELDLLASRVVRLNMAESRSVLESLYALLDAVSHMPVSKDIQGLVESTLAARRETESLLARGLWTEAGLASQRAVKFAQQAFFHPDMLPALYFPDEHLYAVYLPLFLPITVPLVVALLKMIANKKKQKQQKVATD